MKKSILAILLALLAINTYAQDNPTTIIANPQDSRVITTGMPFLQIAADARAGSLGDMGVATSVDGFSQQWNSAKYAFSETKQGIAMSYTPYLSGLVNDIFLGGLTYFNRLNERSAFAASFRYFSLGEIEFVEDEYQDPFTVKPYELAVDVSYNLRLGDHFSMGVAGRYNRSDLRLNVGNVDASAASTFGVDIGGYYQSEEEAYSDFNGRWRGGFAIQNIGPKFKYDEAGVENFQPTTLRLGGGFDFILDEYNKIAITGEVTKLLVPTPPVMGRETEYEDVNGNGVYDEDIDVLGDYTNGTGDYDLIYEGQSDDVAFLSGMFQSFGDAPGGFSEEMQEFTWALGAEYMYQDSFGFRVGYFHESEEKGARQFMALGAGFKYNVIAIDLSYLFSTSKVQSPLENTLRFSLTFNLGAGTYTEY
ncbi:type IX secretion system outer membrane channel protein PorV [Formosa sp. PL04]|uniref:type IX secretion system outer membrane channel protein PorV n=1 Tax=Formosa sp. PL04 TaxID=3081755 RepID=UPI0029823405|nr:type IX secretion system outer membrane channel protein PorV [Formosa sp. PL04]MDW5290460.1 type IX secretion system outer membrane channel protein PorV [Formosa sp. PL04]